MLERKYMLLEDDTKVVNGVKVYRIKAVRTVMKNAQVAVVEKGKLGGYVEKESNLSHDGKSWVADSAAVYGQGYVCANALVKDNAIVCGKTTIWENAVVGGEAKVKGHCLVGGTATIEGNAYLDGRITVEGNALIGGDTEITIDWCQKGGNLQHFHSREVESIVQGIGGTYSMLGTRLNVLRRRVKSVMNHLDGVKDYVEIMQSDIDGMIQDSDNYEEMMKRIEATTLVIRNTKDMMYEDIEDYQQTLCRTNMEEDIPVEEEVKGNLGEALEETETVIEVTKEEEPTDESATEEEKPKKAAKSAKSATKKPSGYTGGRPRNVALEKADAKAKKAAAKKVEKKATKRMTAKERSEAIIEAAMKDAKVRKNLK